MAIAYSEPQYDIRWDSHLTVDEDAHPFRVGLRYMRTASDDPSIHDLIGDLYLDGEVPDSRATWHRNYTRLAPWLKAHILREAMGWKETRLARYFEENPLMATEYGFFKRTDFGGIRPTPPNQPRLWELWHESFPDTTKDYCRLVAKELVSLARDNGIPAPDAVFQPEETDATSERSEIRLIAEKTEEVWRQAKPFVTDCFSLKRGQNWQIHENAFWEQHTYMGMREDMYARGGHRSFIHDTSRTYDETPTGSTHRYQLGKLSVEEIRSMLRNTTRMLIARARHNSELVGKLWAAIDVTKGFEFTGDLDGYEDEILGYSDGKPYYQWAVIKLVGFDIPLVLDAIPRVRGQSKDEIVDELLTHATDMVDDLDLVMMDREFDSAGVKDTCETHGVHYLNPTRIFNGSDEAATIDWMLRNDEYFHVTEEDTPDGVPSRKQIYLPKRTGSDEDVSEENEAETEEEEVSDVRQEMLDEWGFENDDLDEGTESPFARLLADIRREEETRKLRATTKDEKAREDPGIVVFETNHPYVTAQDADGQQMDGKAFIHMVERMVRRYRHRWGIENGFKKLKHFMVRTTSKERNYRFFNFAFACVLYNVWRLVDLLVKLAIEGENSAYKPRVDANQFLTVAKKYYGLDPPD